MDYYKDRFLLPVLIPLGAMSLIAAVAFSMSRVLLNVPKVVATSVALMMALNLLAVCGFVALRPELNLRILAPLMLVVLIPLLVGGVVASGAIELEGAKGHEEVASLLVVSIGAKNSTFNTSEMSVPAEKAFKIRFTNSDTDFHNVTILKEKGSPEALFKKPFFGGPKTQEWTASPIPAGTYYFQCDVHPNMNGRVTAA